MVFTIAAWKMSKQGVISRPYFPVFGLNIEKYGTEITPYLDTFHAGKWETRSFTSRVTSMKWTVDSKY